MSNNESLSNLEREFFNKCDEYIKTQRDISTELLKELQDEDFEKNYKIRIDAQIGVALNGNKISSNKDFEKVTVIKDVPNYDLGIIAPFGITSMCLVILMKIIRIDMFSNYQMKRIIVRVMKNLNYI